MLVRDVANVIEHGTRVVIRNEDGDLADMSYDGGLFVGCGLADMEVLSMSAVEDRVFMYVRMTSDSAHDAMVRLSRLDYLLSYGDDTDWHAVMMLAREVGAIAETALGHSLGR